MKTRIAAAVLAVAALGVTACAGRSGSFAGHTTATTPANQLVCQHYRAQNAWRQGLIHGAGPGLGLADVAKWIGYMAADEALATPGTKLHHDLQEGLAYLQGKPNTYKDGTITRDCG